MARTKKEVKPTHRATLSTGETVDYHGAHPTHWTFGGVDADGNKDGSRVRTVRVTSIAPLHEFPDAVPVDDEDDNYDDDEDDE